MFLVPLPKQVPVGCGMEACLGVVEDASSPSQGASAPREMMLGRAVIAALVGMAVAWCVPARAQNATGNASRAVAAAAVPRACKPEIARFCPEIDAGAPQARTAAICLKPFKTSLSLPCRKAVRGVFP